MVVLLILVVSLVFVIGLAILERRRLGRYWLRSCSGAEWRRCFPDASKEEIRSFLQAFVDAFGFRSTNRLAFKPGDMVLDVYRTVYPGWAVVDAMEFKGQVKFDTSKADGQFKKTADNKKLRMLKPEYKFTEMKVGIKKAVDWFVENYETCRK